LGRNPDFALLMLQCQLLCMAATLREVCGVAAQDLPPVRNYPNATLAVGASCGLAAYDDDVIGREAGWGGTGKGRAGWQGLRPLPSITAATNKQPSGLTTLNTGSEAGTDGVVSAERPGGFAPG